MHPPIAGHGLTHSLTNTLEFTMVVFEFVPPVELETA